MCENKKPKITVVELKSEENSPAPDLHLTASEAGSTEEMPVSDGCKSRISEDLQKIRPRKANFEQGLCPKTAVSVETSSPGPTDSEQRSTGEGRIMQVRTDEPSKSPVDEGGPSVVNLSVVDHNVTETTASNSAANPHPIEADVAIQTLVNEMFTGHTPVESTIPQSSRSDAQDLCPFCGLMLHRKNLQVHLRRKHPDQVSNEEKPAPAQVKNPKQQRLPLRQQQKVAVILPRSERPLNKKKTKKKTKKKRLLATTTSPRPLQDRRVNLMSSRWFNVEMRNSPGPISLAENEFKCLFCKKTGEYPALVAHVQTHERSAVKHKDININHHRPSTGIDRKNGNFTVGGPVTGPIAMESVIRDVFRHCIRFPVPISASVVADELMDTASDKRCITVLARWSQCDLERGLKLRFSQRWTLLCKHDTIELALPSGTSSHIEKELLSCQSPSGTLQAVIREEAGHQYLEVWGQNGLEKSLDLIALNKHGKVYEDGISGSPVFRPLTRTPRLSGAAKTDCCSNVPGCFLQLFRLQAHTLEEIAHRFCLKPVAADFNGFACLAWSPCEKKLLYVAEKKRVEPSAQSSIVSASEDGGLVLLEEQDKNVYIEDWGEGLVGKSCPVLCVADLNKAAVIVYAGVPPNISPGQALWGPNGRGVIFVGQWNEPFRLGLKFCSNRRSALFYLDMKGNCDCLSPEGVSVSSPRMSPDSCWIVYLQGQVFGPHHQCLSMMLYDIKNRSTSVLVDVVRRAEKGQFAGIYESLPSQCWSADSERIFFSSACENNKAVFSVDRTTGRLTQVCGLDVLRLDDFGSVQLFTIQKDLMVMSCSSPNQPPCLRVGFLSTVDQAEDMQLCNLGGADVYEEFCWQPMLITPPSQEENHQFSGLNFGAILIKPYSPPERRKTPLVVNIHGGPHAHFAADWNATAAALSKLGFAVLMVNYRGSTGFGQDSIESLLGNVGSQDVKDVQRAVLCALQNETTLDPDRVAVMGGSHGGFLACHLVGQYPDFYRACAARNPVINAATLLGTSDIIDWRYSSVGLQYAFDRLPTSQSLASMLEKSPIIHAAQIRAPVLLMLGGRDRRVSPHQGLELYRALKSRNTPVRLLWYSDEGHSLSKVNTQSDCFLNIVLWFKEHLN
ncbi:Acylamino-acid-releasing enzyme [Anabarilius grahami]|uniref:acylaminoacyl-peptidase n=1 Tax=Anabarilius grahami TaxID=495550 RepID=A0A3N0YT28_ANAGA|nr:Acylamino-acid-releasing enzyme [Anabarilius grahami]